MALQYSTDGATIQKARKRFCKHPVISLSEANCDAQVREARASAPDHRVKSEESCSTCNSSIQEDVMAMLTNSIIPDVAKFFCTGCGDIIPFIEDPLQQCTSCETTFRARETDTGI